MKNVNFIIALTTLIGLTGCKYEYNYPITEIAKMTIEVTSVSSLVESYGYTFAEQESYFMVTDYDNQILEDWRSVVNNEGYPYTLGWKWLYLTTYCYGYKDAAKELICVIEYKKEDLSKFVDLYDYKPYDTNDFTLIFTIRDIESIEFVNEQPGNPEKPDTPNEPDAPDTPENPDTPSNPETYNVFIKGFPSGTKINAVEEYGYELMSQQSYFYTLGGDGDIQKIGNLTSGREDYTFSVPEIGLYCDCYGRKTLWNNELVCRIYSKLVSTEWLSNTTSKNNPYQFEVDRIEYFVDN